MKEIKCNLATQEGRSIWVLERITMGQLRKAAKLQEQVDNSGEGFTMEAFDDLFKMYAKFVPRWTFVNPETKTDLPQPEDGWAAFDELTMEELTWVAESIFGGVSTDPQTGQPSTDISTTE